MTKYQSPSDLLRIFSHNTWSYVSCNPEKAYTAEVPTIYDCFEKFKPVDVSLWIQSQVLALYGSSSNKDKGVIDGIELFCDSFASQVKGFKLSELMLFFARYKAGKYDNSYSTFDARRIGNAFFKEFIPERARELDKIERENILKRIEERRFVPPEGYTSLSWYLELIRRAAAGDKHALQELSPM